MDEIPNICLSLPNKAENVLLVRQALGGLADVIGLDPVELNDITTAVTEACNNVVVHAYGGETGLLEVEILACPPVLRVVVRDLGGGIGAPAPDAERTLGGIGLPVIRALASKVEFASLEPGPGTEVRMEFATSQELKLEEPTAEARFEFPAIFSEELKDTMAIDISPCRLARSVLPRVLSGLAARAHFPTDRIHDTQLLADTLVVSTDESIDASHLSVLVGVAASRLELQLGPLGAGRSNRLLGSGATDPSLEEMLERIADSYELAPVSGAATEVLAMHLASRQ